MSLGLELTDVAVGYRHRMRRPDRVILRTEHIAARAGAVTALIGANGTGKSTLLRSIAALQPLLSGRMRLGEEDVIAMSPGRRARQLAVVLTDRIDGALLTARDVVALGRTPHQSWFPGGRDEPALVDAALERMGATEFARARFNELSDGQRQRILIARALAQEPSLLILDEPSSFLDVAARTELLLQLRQLAENTGIVVLLSTHDVELALRLIPDIWLARSKGQLIAGNASELITTGLISSEFDSPAVRFNADTGQFDPRA